MHMSNEQFKREINSVQINSKIQFKLSKIDLRFLLDARVGYDWKGIEIEQQTRNTRTSVLQLEIH